MIRVMLYGRGGEQATIDRLLARARAGEGGGLVLRGEPGIGKSALVTYAAERAGGMRLLRAAGVEAESTLAYATLHRLLRPVLGWTSRLPGPQAGALAVAFGLQAGATPDRFLVSVAVLTLLSEVAGTQPLLCLVDDVQWADTASAEVLAFVARRLEAEPVALLMAVRAGEGGDAEGTGLAQLELTGLDADDGAALLHERWGARLAPAVRAQLVRATGGNPLALIELPGSLTAGQLAGRDPLPEPLPLASELQRTFLERTRRQGPDVQQLLLLAAADGLAQLATIRRAAEGLGLDASALETGALADLVHLDGTAVVFRHPLMGAAVYHGASPAARRAAHQALAEAFGDEEEERRAWHRA
ncbi:MAG TPA: ATP-binding protein, partial [Chloroflexota bacterium]|nr:ATP-binding protein [Chloroflexota bacterium]